jgi:hypothetical protein
LSDPDTALQDFIERVVKIYGSQQTMNGIFVHDGQIDDIFWQSLHLTYCLNYRYIAVALETKET